VSVSSGEGRECGGLGSALAPKLGVAGYGSKASISRIRISSFSCQSEVVWIFAPRCKLNCHSVELVSCFDCPNSQFAGGKMVSENKRWRHAEYFVKGRLQGWFKYLRQASLWARDQLRTLKRPPFPVDFFPSKTPPIDTNITPYSSTQRSGPIVSCNTTQHSAIPCMLISGLCQPSSCLPTMRNLANTSKLTLEFPKKEHDLLCFLPNWRHPQRLF
jgi:hypothetical protein